MLHQNLENGIWFTPSILTNMFLEAAEEDSLLLVNEDEAEKRAHRKSLALQVSLLGREIVQ